MPAPETNVGATFEYLLKRNADLLGMSFALGPEDAIYLVGRVPVARVDEDELDRIIGASARLRRRVLPDGHGSRLRRHVPAPAAGPAPSVGLNRPGVPVPSAGRAASSLVACPRHGCSDPKLLVVGGGRMGSALLGGLLRAGWAAVDELAVCEPDHCPAASGWPPPSRPRRPAAPIAGRRSAVFAVKPEVAEPALAGVRAVGMHRVLSIVAGLAPPPRGGAGPGRRRHPGHAQQSLGDRLRSRRHVRREQRRPPPTSSGPRESSPPLGRSGASARAPARRRHRLVGERPCLRLPGRRGADRGRCGCRPRPRGEPPARRRDHGRLCPDDGRDRCRPGRAAGRGDLARRDDGGRTVRSLEGKAVRSAFIEAVAAATERSRQLGR